MARPAVAAAKNLDIKSTAARSSLVSSHKADGLLTHNIAGFFTFLLCTIAVVQALFFFWFNCG
jgi:hypothetical protein